MYRTMQRAIATAVLLALLAVFLPAAALPASPPVTVRIGVLVNRSPGETVRIWSPTAEYLGAQIPGFAFTIVPLEFRRIVAAVGRGEVDFVLANPSIYVELETRHDTTRLVTLKNAEASSRFGGVIFCRASRNDIRELGDLRGKSFAAVNEASLDGWQVAWRELMADGIDPLRDFSALAFLQTHDAVVSAVRDGRFDAGTVRTDILERLARAGLISMADYRIVNPQRRADFPFVVSTRLYPEWPFAKVYGTPEALAKKVAVSLLSMSPDSPAALAADLAGWTTPLVYQPVHDLMKELRIGPYRDFGKIPLRAALLLYWYWVALAALALVAMGGITTHLVRLNRRLRQSREELEDSRRGLEAQVLARTADLERSNADLRHEVNQRKQAELDSHLAREEWELTFNSIPDLIAIIGTDYRVLKVNRSLAEKVGRPPEALVGETCSVIICGAGKPAALCPHPLTQADGGIHSSEMHLVHLGGDFLVTTSPLNDAEGGSIGVVHICRDITAAVRARQEREEARRFLQAVIDGVSEEIMVIAPDHRVVLMNLAAREVTSADTYCYCLSHGRDTPCEDDHPCPLQTVIETKKPVTVTHTHRRRSGAAFQVEILASPIFDAHGEVKFVVEACRDVTEKLALGALQQKVQEQRSQEQKEQSIATLAGGIAHDFNNILMGVIGNAELLALISPATEPQQERIGTIIELSKRMAHLTGQLLAYSRQGAYERRELSLNDAVAEAAGLAHPRPASAVEVKAQYQQDLWPVLADPSQISQVLVSLLTNAFEAMETGGGRLSILTENIRGKAAWECSLKHHHPGGDFVHLRIADSGHGIPADIQPRIFDPFFTTRFMGRGLGLSAALGIVRNHGGCISVESAPGRGASFDVYLPAQAAAATDGEPQRRPKAYPARKILVVEDEATVLALLQTLLARLGFEAIPAESGARALALFAAERKDIALAILDIQMEGMDGKQLARELKTIDPDLKVLISSGYDEQTALLGLERRYFEGFIHKPYGLDGLRTALLRLLGD